MCGGGAAAQELAGGLGGMLWMEEKGESNKVELDGWLVERRVEKCNGTGTGTGTGV